MSQPQLEISFEPGLLDQFPNFRDCVRASVYGCGRQFKVIAADLDMSQSHLSRMLSESGDLHLPAERLAELVEITGDKRPVYWLVEYFLEDEDSRKRRAVQTLEHLLPQIQQALDNAKE